MIGRAKSISEYICLSIKRYERVIDYVLSEQSIKRGGERRREEREREKLIKYSIENKYLNQSRIRERDDQ